MRLNVLTNLAVTAILVFSLNACKEKGTIVSESTYSIPTTLGGYSLDQVLRKYDLSSVDGYIALAQQERDGMILSALTAPKVVTMPDGRQITASIGGMQ